MHAKKAPPPSPMGHLSLHTSFSSSPPNSASYARSDCSTVSPLSSTTTSPASSPTSPFRRLCRQAWFPASDNKIDNSLITTTGTENKEQSQSRSRSQSQASFRLSLNHHLNALRRPSSSLLFLLRRRPSKIDLALSEERARCDEDAAERKGVGLLEPRPVDPAPAPVPVSDMSSGDERGLGSRSSMQSLSAGFLSPVLPTSLPAQPRFVMGGIEEVLAGEA
ncbi:uncharacterized protein EURHEDRAFT_402551 [Aspergillus ruber CBS 135680]|uniref:Uncharacterized protein n=1 Tax=Aspergillus ruber (strain CBS 135680) TaxID=1388766 RepID=A0A017SEH1_ASPRC|nr:uncharacterized protein EURHEDRAFT_402551 [Aspergillus ruber CBS 135680]EYE95357.1 hypothetical protein EURHEDRAFT_402551 [Aspergillus ruber CBS 135680]